VRTVDTTTLLPPPSGSFSTDTLKSKCLFVSPGNLVVAEEEDRPDADRLPGDVSIPNIGTEDFGRGRCIETCKRGCLVPDEEEQLHPQRVMREDGLEYIGDAEIPAPQRRPEGVTEIGAFDQLLSAL
jgi:hypothetical protein